LEKEFEKKKSKFDELLEEYRQSLSIDSGTDYQQSIMDCDQRIALIQKMTSFAQNDDL
jgi:hypothetical protein